MAVERVNGGSATSSGAGKTERSQGDVLMTTMKMSILAACIAIAGLCLMIPQDTAAQVGGDNVITNGEFTAADPSSPNRALGWEGGRRVFVNGEYAGEVVGPAGVLAQVIPLSKVAELLAQGRGNFYISFQILNAPPVGSDTGLFLSFAGRVFDVDQYRNNAANPGKVEISFMDDDFKVLGDRTLAFQVKGITRRILLDDISLTCTASGGNGEEVEPTPTVNPEQVRPPSGLGTTESVDPNATPTPRPASGLDTESFRITVNPPIVYITPGSTGTRSYDLTFELKNRDGSAISSDEAADRNAKVTFELLGDQEVGYLSSTDKDGNVRKLTTAKENFADYLLGSTENNEKGVDPKQISFNLNQAKDGLIRLMVRVEIDAPRPGQKEDLSQPLELCTVVPIVIRTQPGVSAKGTMDARGLAPLQRFNRIFVESPLPSGS